MSAGGILTSTASGVAAGSTLGVPGMIGGAAIGLASGVLGHINEKKQLDAQNAAITKQKLLQRQQNFMGQLEPQPANIPLMPFGGAVQSLSEQVELENGEPFKSPNGSIDSIPTDAPSHTQGGVPITLANGTQVLGKLKNTEGKQFKTIGRKLEKAQSKYIKTLQDGPTSITAKTAERMLNNINKEFDDLFIEQENTKKVGQGDNMKYPDGGKITTERGVSTPYYRKITPTTFNQQLLRKNVLQPGYDTLSIPQLNEQIRTGYNIPEGFALPYKAELNPADSTINYYKDYGRNAGEYYDPQGSGEVVDTYNKPRETYARGGMIRKGQTGLFAGGLEPISGSIPTTNADLAYENFIPTISQPVETSPQGLRGFDLPKMNTALSTAASLAPVAYNLIQGAQGAEQYNPSDYYNPYEAQAQSAMRQRRYNIQPELEQNRLNQATYYRNLREGAPSQSQFLGGLQAGAIGKSRADASTIARQQNINNQYLGEQAQFDAQLGAQRAQTRLGVDQMNAQNRAAQRGMIGTGLSQVSQFAQNKELMNNQMLRDAQRLGVLDDLVSNYEFRNGKWIFKATGQEQSQEEIFNFIKGRK